MSNIGVRFRQVNDYAGVHGFMGGFPNFHQADYECGVVYGTFLIRPGQTEWRDIPADALGNPPGDDVGARFRATADYATQNGFVGGYPNFHQANYGQGTVYGTFLFRSDVAEWRDVAASELGNPPGDDIDARFRATNDYAVRQGFAAGFPNFHQADYGQGIVYGTVLLRHEAVEWRDVLADVFTIFTNFTFDNAITAGQRATLLERHSFALSQICGCNNLQPQERTNLLQAYRRNIWHGINTTPGVNASAIVGGNQIRVNFGVLFPQGANEIAQTLIHEMMHCAGYTHPNRTPQDSPLDGGAYYGSPPLQAEICIAGSQSDLLRVSEKADHDNCVVDDDGHTIIYMS